MLDIAIFVWVLLFLIALIALGRCQSDRHGNRHLISANGIFLITFILYFIFPALNPILTGGIFYWAASYSSKTLVLIVMCSLVWALLVYILGYELNSRPLKSTINKIQPSHKTQTNRHTINIALFMILAGVAMKIMAIMLGGGVDETIIRMSKGVSETNNITAASTIVGQLRNFSGLSEAGVAYLLLESLRTRRYRLLTISLFVLVVGFAMISTGKRLYVLWPILIAIAGFACYIKILSPGHLILLLPLGLFFGFLTLMFRIYMPLYFAGDLSNFDISDVPWANDSIWLFYFNSLEFSFFELTAAAFIDHEAIDRILGGPLLAFYRPHIEPILYIIPRVIWAGKPENLVDISHAMSAIIFNNDITLSSFGIATGLTGTSYILGGIIGFTLAFFFLGLMCRRIDKIYISNRYSGETVSPMRIVWLAFWLMIVFHLFRQGTIGWVFMITIVQQLGILIGFAAISILPRFTIKGNQKVKYA